MTGAYPVLTYNTTQSQDNHAPHGSHANWFGTVKHIASAEPALGPTLGPQHPQPATHQFNFSPGSYATFPVHYYQIIGRLETHQPIHGTPVEAEPEVDDSSLKAFMKECTNGVFDDPGDEGDSSSKDPFGELPEGVDGPQNPGAYRIRSQQPSKLMRDTTHPQGTMPASFSRQTSTLAPGNYFPPPPYPHCQQQPSTFEPDNFSLPPSYHQSPQQQPIHDTNADYDVFTQHDASSLAINPQTLGSAVANSEGDQTESDTHAFQASLAHTQTTLSPAKKRRRSKLNDGSMAREDAPKLKAKRKRTKKSEDVDVGPINFGQGVLRNMSSEDAEDYFLRSRPLKVGKEGDDVDAVVAEKESWIREIMAAFDKPWISAPTVPKFHDSASEFGPWQEKHYRDMMKNIKADKTGAIIEAAATVIYSRVVRSHQTKVLVGGCRSLDVHRSLTCSKRLKKCIDAIEKLTIIRHDMVTNKNIVELIANPLRLMNRKQECKAAAGERKENLETYVPPRPARKSVGGSVDSGASEVSMSASNDDESLDVDGSDPGARSFSI